MLIFSTCGVPIKPSLGHGMNLKLNRVITNFTQGKSCKAYFSVIHWCVSIGGCKEKTTRGQEYRGENGRVRKEKPTGESLELYFIKLGLIIGQKLD